MIWFCLYYVLFDYIFYNITKDKDYEAPTYYRIMQVVFCWVPGFYFLTLTEFAQFFILWWTFCMDWGYYVIEIILNPKHTKEDFANGITHAYWTPYGLVINKFKTIAIPVPVLIIQSVIGIVLAVYIQ